MISIPMTAADFRPCPEEAAEGLTAGRGLLLYASRHQLRAWPG